MNPQSPQTNAPFQMKSSGLLQVGIVVLLMTMAFFFGTWSEISPHLLDLTNPITSVTGRIVANPDNQSLVIQTKNKQLKVKVGERTFLTDAVAGPARWPYLLKPPPPPSSTPVKLSDFSKDLKVTVDTVEDLRTLKKLEVTANKITLFPAATNIQGTIKNIQGNTMTVEGWALVLPNPGEPTAPQNVKNYTIAISADTEISMLDPAKAVGGEEKILQYSLNDLRNQKDPIVRIYTADNVEKDDSVTALRIEPTVPL